MNQNPQHLSKEYINQARALFGPAPILSSETPQFFEIFFEQLVNCLFPRDFVEVMLIWRYSVEAWRVNRAILHGTVAIERRYEEGIRQKLQRARLQHAQKQQSIRDDITSHTPADIATLAALEEDVQSTLEDMDEIYKRKATEREHNIAFERSMIFQEQLDKLIISGSRRRDDILQQLELYRVGLGAEAREMSGRLLECNTQEMASTTVESPTLAPTHQGALIAIAEGSNRKAIEEAAGKETEGAAGSENSNEGTR